MHDCKIYKLNDICDYVNSRISNVVNYISTENMLPNKGGICESSSIPAGSVVAYKAGDILVSNIRPYFQKIWYSDRDGGCSADVLCIRAKENVDSKYLYYLLSQQAFFDYVMSGAKGSKMPRGDKKQIMQWPVNLPPQAEQKRIAAILSALDDKIELNRRINANLEQQAQTLFKLWFVRNNDDCNLGKLGDIIEIFDSQRKPLSGNERDKMQKLYPYYGAAALMDYVNDYLFDGIYLLLGEDGTVVTNEGFPVLQYVEGKFWVNNHAHILQGKNGFSVETLYILLSQTNIQSIITGAVQPKISQYNLKNLQIPVLPIDKVTSYDDIIQPMFKQIRKNNKENCALELLRDTLLTKLMLREINI